MDFLSFILGVLLIILGIFLVILYRSLKKQEKGILSFRIQSAGIGFTVIGIVLIVRELV